MTLAVVVTALSLGAFAGCYTKLMPFKDAVAVRKASVAQNRSGGNFTSDLNYRDNCLSCHSEAELADRAGDMDYAGIHTVHDLPYDPYGWQNPYTQPPWWQPEPIILIGGGPMGQPVIMTNPSGTGSAPATTLSPSNANRRRETGSTRTSERTRDANPTATSTPAPTPAPTSSGSSGPGAVTIIAPSQPAQTPAPAPAADTRTRSGSSEGSNTRKSGSGRE